MNKTNHVNGNKSLFTIISHITITLNSNNKLIIGLVISSEQPDYYSFQTKQKYKSQIKQSIN